MSIFKCKMCGGALEIKDGESVAVCEYCGTKQTLPKLDDEKRANLYDRANHFRRNNEFDKAAGIYEQILNEDIGRLYFAVTVSNMLKTLQRISVCRPSIAHSIRRFLTMITTVPRSNMRTRRNAPFTSRKPRR